MNKKNNKSVNSNENYQKPKIGSLPSWYRKTFFWFLFTVFIVILPFLGFYTTGYRLDLTKDKADIIVTGGIYVELDKIKTEVYLDEKPVKQPRFFRSAYYIQDIFAGLHRVVVQGQDLQTWVKELPVYPYLVTKVSAFNMPLRPQVRLISKYISPKGLPIFAATDNLSLVLEKASSTYKIATIAPEKIKNFGDNDEYKFISGLFKKLPNSKKSLLSESYYLAQTFRFATTTATTADDEVVQKDEIILFPEAGELWAGWTGKKEDIPDYFCIVNNSNEAVIKSSYGDHVGKAVNQDSNEQTTFLLDDRLCRTKIRLDRKNMDIYFYDFVPTYSNLVLLQLEDGLYVTEIDDRSWQNTQLLYPGKDFQVLVNNNSIFVRDGEIYFEVLTKVETK